MLTPPRKSSKDGDNIPYPIAINRKDRDFVCLHNLKDQDLTPKKSMMR